MSEHTQPQSKLFPILRWISLALLLSALGVAVLQALLPAQTPGSYPAGTTIAGIPVGGLDRSQAADRLVQAFNQPVELHYRNHAVQVSPLALGFQLDLDAMLTQADQNTSVTVSYWDRLWNKTPQAEASQITLDASLDEAILKDYLQSQISARYDLPPSEALPQAASTRFLPGTAGQVLNIEASLPAVEAALRSPSARTADLIVEETPAGRASFQNLEILIKQLIDVSNTGILAEVYLKDLQTGEVMHFAYQPGEDLTPDIAFTAASTIKIPIMISAMRRISFPLSEDDAREMSAMIMYSKNEATDAVMANLVDSVYGPIYVTDDMQTLGLQNTILGGFFYLGAPLLRRYETPANSRPDINLEPDIYNQTTPAEMAALLEGIYHCSQDGSGLLTQTFPDGIDQEKCQAMVDLLVGDHLPYLITAGVPEGTTVAHKHGWIEETDGLLHTMSDVAIVYTPGGNYILTLYMYHPIQLIFDPGNELAADISTAIYNDFNIDAQK